MVRASRLVFLLIFACAALDLARSDLPATSANSSTSLPEKESSMFQIKSNAFQGDANIPSRFTCEGENISPELSWSGAPQGTKTFALVLHDPDAPRRGGYTHWVVFNIPATENQVAENAPKNSNFPGGGTQGKNDDGSSGYTGPCPPSGTHRYYFHLYAVDQELNLRENATGEQLQKALKGHIVGQAEFMGRYQKGAGKAA
jgi:Raf kinase inhibitor-like YbhB/YbcL family protein